MGAPPGPPAVAVRRARQGARQPERAAPASARCSARRQRPRQRGRAIARAERPGWSASAKRVGRPWAERALDGEARPGRWAGVGGGLLPTRSAKRRRHKRRLNGGHRAVARSGGGWVGRVVVVGVAAIV